MRHERLLITSILVLVLVGGCQQDKVAPRSGLLNLPVRAEGHRLKVSMRTDKADYRPGQTVTATVKVTDERGKPVVSEVALVAADEGVLSLINYKTPDPVSAFYAPWDLAVTTATQYMYLRDLPGPNTKRPATGGDSGGPGSVRSRFLSTAVWKPGIVTNARGVARVTFVAPDNLTAFRLMAVAADRGHRFGSAERRFTVSKPLQLHRILPRFAVLGDTFFAGVTVHNETGKAGQAKVTLGHGALLGHGELATKTITVPPSAQVPVLFPVEALGLGTAKLTFTVEMDGESDAVRFEIPVQHPSAEKSRHVAYGVADGDKSIAIHLPKEASLSTAKVHVSVDPNGLAGLEEGLFELVGYPYGCLEQTTSKVIPMISVRELAEKLDLPELRGGKLDEYVKEGIAKIGRHQTSLGGFSLWPGGEPQEFYTAYALWGLYLAKEAGYTVDQTRIDDGLSYLRRDNAGAVTADHYDSRGHAGNRAFVVYVRGILGDPDVQLGIRLQEEDKDMPIYGKAFLARSFAQTLGAKDPMVTAIVRDLKRLVRESQDGLLHEPSEGTLHYYMSSTVRTSAIVLDTLLSLAPESEEIPTLVHALMERRRSKAYTTTQGNLFSLLALEHYARSRPKGTKNVLVSLDGKELIDGPLEGPLGLRSATAELMQTQGTLQIRAVKGVHYNVRLSYRQKKGAIFKENNGLEIRREYLDEQGNPKTSFQVGDQVLVRLTLTMKDDMSHVMVSDRFPAGFEAVNGRFATAPTAKTHQANRYWGGYREMRDDRVDFSSEYSWRGVHVYEYTMRASTEGNFAVPPAHVEAMYEPDVNGQTGLGFLTVTGK